VRVTIGRHTYRTTVASRGGRFLVPLSAENRAAAGVAAGEQVDVEYRPTPPRARSPCRPISPTHWRTTARRMPLRSHDDAGAALARLIGDRRLLLVLDNCEHLIGARARLAEACSSATRA